MNDRDEKIRKAAQLFLKSSHATAFTGAGISVESGIPPFRGQNGLWTKFDPICLDLTFFLGKPEESWPLIKHIFYDSFANARPNKAHFGLALLERKGVIRGVITQNIDNLHQEAGNKNVIEFHGNSKYLKCTGCQNRYNIKDIHITNTPPSCPKCKKLLKPDFVFFGEGIPQDAYYASLDAAEHSDLFLLVGTSGEVVPANQIPFLAKQNGAKIVEINVTPSVYTDQITDIFINGQAGEVMEKLVQVIFA